MKLNRQEIQAQAFAVLQENRQGIRWSDLLTAIEERAPDTPRNSIRGGVHNLLISKTDEIIKVGRGIYQLSKFLEVEDAIASKQDLAIAEEPVQGNDAGHQSLTEQDFYPSFAEWLEENDEATFASPLGGSVLGGKWGTPDVIGVLKPRAQDIVKVVPSQPVIAFGQAVAYRLFCHKSYMVIPNSTSGDDMTRLTALCGIHGVGLVTFALDQERPDYLVVVPPTLATPDMFYVNRMLERLKVSEPRLLNKLF
jgi:hypothetical protein